MKSGCFLKTIIFTTILLAVIFYLLINKYDEYVAKPIKEFVINLATEELKERISKVTASPERDSLLNFMDYAGNRILELKVINEEAFSPLKDSIKSYIGDNVINREEFNNIQSLFEETIANEKRKKN